MHRPAAICSMSPAAIRTRRSRHQRRMLEVDAMRTKYGLASDAPLGPVLRQELWAIRRAGTSMQLLTLADTFHVIAADQRITPEEVAAQYEATTVVPTRQRAGEHLADLVDTDGRPEWADPDRLVSSVEPPSNGELNPAYLRIVKDLDDQEFVLVTSYDGSEPMAWPHDDAGLMAAYAETLDRVRAATESGAYDEWLAEEGAPADGPTPYTQSMTDGDFLAHHDGMHLV